MLTIHQAIRDADLKFLRRLMSRPLWVGLMDEKDREWSYDGYRRVLWPKGMTVMPGEHSHDIEYAPAELPIVLPMIPHRTWPAWIAFYHQRDGGAWKFRDNGELLRKREPDQPLEIIRSIVK